ncbi:hypothetical protein KKC59_01645, partial [bacterium]|nr:hypothetical protein [bacterium]
YSNRKGWVFDINPEISDTLLINQFQELKQKGAKYFVVTEIENYKSHTEFLKHIINTCKEVVIDEGYRIYQISE